MGGYPAGAGNTVLRGLCATDAPALAAAYGKTEAEAGRYIDAAVTRSDGRAWLAHDPTLGVALGILDVSATPTTGVLVCHNTFHANVWVRGGAVQALAALAGLYAPRGIHAFDVVVPCTGPAPRRLELAGAMRLACGPGPTPGTLRYTYRYRVQAP